MKIQSHTMHRIELLLTIFCGLLAAVISAFAQTWTPTGAPTRTWDTIASSADGTKLVAAVYAGGIYTSTNSGATWTLTSAPSDGGIDSAWESVASSADGSKLVAVAYYDNPIYVSTNSGMNWSSNGPSEYWQSVACSADGNKLIAAASINGPIYISTNCGTTWIQATNAPNLWWQTVATSADGNILVAAPGGSGPAGPIYVSPDAGNTWVQTPSPYEEWMSVAISADGTKMAALSDSSANPQPSTVIYTSTNSGATWVPKTIPGEYWWSVASSADGSKLMALAYWVSSYNGATTYTGGIFTSTNSGTDWTQTIGPGTNYWWSGATSADGCKLVAAVSGGGIYSSLTRTTPLVNIASFNQKLDISWIMPSTNFVLQQNRDLTTTNWVTMMSTPILNLTNLQEQVVLSPTNNRGFYRLATP